MPVEDYEEKNSCSQVWVQDPAPLVTIISGRVALSKTQVSHWQNRAKQQVIQI